MHYSNVGGPQAPFDPLMAWGELAQRTWTVGPLSFSFASNAQRFAHCYRWFQEAIAAFGTPAFDIDGVEIAGETIPVIESVVHEAPFCKLRAFECTRADGAPGRPRVLLVAPLAGHHAVLMCEAVQSLLQHADVYVTDWSDARDVPVSAGRFGLDDCVLEVQRCMTMLDPARLHVLAICQGTVPALAAAARVAAGGGPEPRTLTLMGGPVDARLSPTALDRMAAGLSLPWLDAVAIGPVPAGYGGAGRRVYPGFLQYPALVAAQPDRHFSLMFDYLYRRPRCEPHAARRIEREVAQYGAVLDMAAEFFLDTLRVVFQRALLPKGQWHVAGATVRPECLRTTRLLTIEAECDDISGVGQTHAAHELCSALSPALRQRLSVAGCDHYGLFSGERWRTTVHPLVRAWMADVQAGGSAV